ncbi:MAG TPA: hypothetical protein VLP30_05645, partial [Desulfatirhabdiaceae bacterium]|nr:hypothetical protein [Desulfatirhabdiaceae bacterium]
QIQDELAPSRFNRSRLVHATYDQKSGIPFTPVNEVMMVSNQSGLVLKSTGEDPQLMLPDCIPDSARSLFLKIRITSPSDTALQIFYRTRGETRFSEAHSVKKAMEKGYNELYLQIPATDYAGPLRIDPGKTPGNYILHSIEVRGVDFNNQQKG